VLLEQTDKLAASQKTLGTEALIRGYWDIIGQYNAIYRCLMGWHKDLQAIVAGPLYWPELSTIECPVFDATDRGRPFAVAFHFPAFAIGQSIVLFWVISMMVNHQICSLYGRIIKLQSSPNYVPSAPRAPKVGVDPLTAASISASNWSEPASPATSQSSVSGTPPYGSSSTPGSTDSPTSATSDGPSPLGEFPPSISAMQAAAEDALGITHTVSNNICQSIEYFLREEMGDVGPLSMILPLTALRHVLCRMVPSKPCPLSSSPDRPGENSDEVLWADFLIKYIGARGQQLANYLEDD
jgi:hypothetical protein